SVWPSVSVCVCVYVCVCVGPSGQWGSVPEPQVHTHACVLSHAHMHTHACSRRRMRTLSHMWYEPANTPLHPNRPYTPTHLWPLSLTPSHTHTQPQLLSTTSSIKCPIFFIFFKMITHD